MMKSLFAFLLAFSALHADPAKWEKDIARFEEKDKKSPPPKDGLLFVGSSSIRLWDLEGSFPGMKIINRGFGGSEIEDSTFYAKRIIIPHKPKVVFLYAGDNDIGRGKSAERVVADYQKFVKTVHAGLPETKIVFIFIKPSLARWKKWQQMDRANQAIVALTKKNPLLDYLDTATPILGKDGKPVPAYLRKDGLHLTKEGYAVWNKVVLDWLKAKGFATPSGE
jgi:lysophospholipase L1-like esterase